MPNIEKKAREMNMEGADESYAVMGGSPLEILNFLARQNAEYLQQKAERAERDRNTDVRAWSSISFECAKS